MIVFELISATNLQQSHEDRISTFTTKIKHLRAVQVYFRLIIHRLNNAHSGSRKQFVLEKMN